MKLLKNWFLLITGFVFLFFLWGLSGKYPPVVEAQDASQIQKDIERYEKELERLSLEAKTLSNQIQQFDAQIKVTELKIKQTEEKITLFGGRIDQLENSLVSLGNAFSSRALETYKMKRSGEFIYSFISAPGLTHAVARYHYLRRIMDADRVLLKKLQDAQNSYKTQKRDQEELVKLLENQKNSLAKDKKAKANLFTVTRNDEKKYQELLAAARAELAIALGQGKETFLRPVKEGDKIGTIISGRSGCSSGTHLHFEVHQGSQIMDPNNYLKPIAYSYASGYDSSYYGGINPRGSWNWPINEPIQINQGFGSHGFARVFYPGGQHNGIDMTSQDRIVKATKGGKLYGGSYQCGGSFPGTLLYAKIEQEDGLTSWYLHMTPQ